MFQAHHSTLQHIAHIVAQQNRSRHMTPHHTPHLNPRLSSTSYHGKERNILTELYPPLLIIGILLTFSPPLPQNSLANGSSKYPRSTALSLDPAASSSVCWMMASCDVVEEPGRREDLLVECLGVVRVKRLGICAISGFIVLLCFFVC